VTLLDMMRRIAHSNHQNKRREFTTANVHDALSGTPMAWALWLELCSECDEVPLIKTLEDAGGGKQNGLYQFKHMSFQEALAAQLLMNSPEEVIKITGRLAEYINEPFNRNLLTIGGGRLGSALAEKHDKWDMQGKLEADGVKAFTDLLRENSYIKSLSIKGCVDITRKGADPQNADQLVEVLPHTSLISFDLRGVNLTYSGGHTDNHAPMNRLIKLLPLTQIREVYVEGKDPLPIKELNGEYPTRKICLSNKKLTHLSSLFIADAIRMNHPSLLELWLDNNKLGLRGAQLIADALTENRTLHLLSLKQNSLEDIGVFGGRIDRGRCLIRHDAMSRPQMSCLVGCGRRWLHLRSHASMARSEDAKVG